MALIMKTQISLADSHESHAKSSRFKSPSTCLAHDAPGRPPSRLNQPVEQSLAAKTWNFMLPWSRSKKRASSSTHLQFSPSCADRSLFVFAFPFFASIYRNYLLMLCCYSREEKKQHEEAAAAEKKKTTKRTDITGEICNYVDWNRPYCCC